MPWTRHPLARRGTLARVLAGLAERAAHVPVEGGDGSFPVRADAAQGSLAVHAGSLVRPLAVGG